MSSYKRNVLPKGIDKKQRTKRVTENLFLVKECMLFIEKQVYRISIKDELYWVQIRIDFLLKSWNLGLQCDKQISPCEPNPCIYGSCQVSEQSFKCICHPGFQVSLSFFYLVLVDLLNVVNMVIRKLPNDISTAK